MRDVKWEKNNTSGKGSCVILSIWMKRQPKASDPDSSNTLGYFRMLPLFHGSSCFTAPTLCEEGWVCVCYGLQLQELCNVWNLNWKPLETDLPGLSRPICSTFSLRFHLVLWFITVTPKTRGSHGLKSQQLSGGTQVINTAEVIGKLISTMLDVGETHPWCSSDCSRQRAFAAAALFVSSLGTMADCRSRERALLFAAAVWVDESQFCCNRPPCDHGNYRNDFIGKGRKYLRISRNHS